MEINTVVVIVLVALAAVMQLLMTRWVVFDARNRGIEPFRWGLLVLASSFVGLFFYRRLRSRSRRIESAPSLQ